MNEYITISMIAYMLYTQEWVSTHTTLKERLQAIKNYCAYIEDILETEPETEIPSFSEWLENFGYEGEIYVCFEEFRNTEYHDKDYILSLLGDDEELIQRYHQDLETDEEAE